MSALDVLRAAARTYSHSGYSLEEKASFEIYIPEIKRIERVIVDSEFSSFTVSEYEEERKRGIEVWVLVPLHALGLAHSYMKNKVDRIQGWWIDNNSVKFSSPEWP